MKWACSFTLPGSPGYQNVGELDAAGDVDGDGGRRTERGGEAAVSAVTFVVVHRMPGTGGGPAAVSDRRMIRVALVDDQPLVRAGLAVLLRSEPALQVVGEAGDGAAAVALAQRECPDLV